MKSGEGVFAGAAAATLRSLKDLDAQEPLQD